jgi:dihydropyrimidinase
MTPLDVTPRDLGLRSAPGGAAATGQGEEAAALDVVVKGGTVVTSGSRFRADVGIRNGKVVRLGEGLEGSEVIRAENMLVLPGGVDMHVHLTPAEVAEGTFAWADDFLSGSRAAAAGGITTVGNMTFPRPGEGLLAALERTAAAADGIVDFVLHPVMLEATDEAIAEVASLAAHGHASLKIFMVLTGFDANPRGFLRALEAAGRAGVLSMVHCEDGCLVSFLAEKLVAEGRGHASNYPAARPVYTESVAVGRAVAFAEAAGAPVYLVHISSREALEVAHVARARGLPVYVETRPDYLHYTEEKLAGDDAALYTGSPPFRTQEDRRALWAGLATGDIQTCCTDHAPWLRAEKLDPGRNVQNMLNGLAELDIMLPLLFSEGVGAGRLSLERFVEVTATNAARLFGLYPAKGTVAVGSDADLVVWDPEAETTSHAADAFSRADYSIYEGWEVKGLPRYTISRGEVIFADGEIRAEPGRGRLVKRSSAGAL